MKLFMMGVEEKSPLVMESISLPCLKILMRLLKPPPPTSKKNKVRQLFSLLKGMLPYSEWKHNRYLKQRGRERNDDGSENSHLLF